ncbi:DsrE family protein [Cellulophaga sp. F20128]|uniref:DsrE family protein n=1 Tax=Cellulophaga sp. F20128 TaxID=2926413 RepID=UPI001FF1FEFD|nr:DsrE family protein [Cellulophaga sp. F20128]MCK0157815.1 DsrE family protein [Cellulophaga sp. F20128]
MKTYINLVLACLFATIALSQEKPVKIVFDVTSSNIGVQKSAIRHVQMMSKSYPDSKFEMVIYSKAYEMVIADKSAVAKEMAALAKNKNVDFVVCQASLNRHKIEASQLIKGVRAVPDGILEIVEKQAQGWGYIKEGL